MPRQAMKLTRFALAVLLSSTLTALAACQPGGLAPQTSLAGANLFVIPRAMPGLAFDGVSLWQSQPHDPSTSTPNAPAAIHRFSLAGKLQASVPTSRNLGTHKSLSWGQGHLWLLDYNNGLHKIDPASGNVVASLDLARSGLRKSEQIVYYAGELWVLEKNYPLSPGVEQPPRLARIDPGSGKLLESFEVRHPGFDALFDNLAYDGSSFYLSKSVIFSPERNTLFRINRRSHRVETRSLSWVQGNVPTLFWHQGRLHLIEQFDFTACNNGCRGVLYSLDFDGPAPDPSRPAVLPSPLPPPPGIQAPPVNLPNQPAGPGLPAGGPALAPYLLPVRDSFKIQAETGPDSEVIARERKAFEQDLESGQVGAYERIPSFSILLAAGSEGSYLSAGSEGSYAGPAPSAGGQLAAGSEGSYIDPNGTAHRLSAGSEGSYFDQAGNLDKLPAAQAGYAKALIFVEGKAPQVVKGQFSEGRFYFQGVVDVPAGNRTYLLALDSRLEVQVFSGKLIGGNLVKGESSSPSASPSASPAPSAVPADPELVSRFAAALERYEREVAGYGEMVSRQVFVPTRNLPPMMRSKVLIRLLEAHPELGSDINELIGLPPVPLDNRIRALRALYKQLYPELFVGADPDDPFANPPMRGRGLAPAPSASPGRP